MGTTLDLTLTPKLLSLTLAQIPFAAMVISLNLLPTSWVTEVGFSFQLSRLMLISFFVGLH